jgi:hypothetical protein
MRILIIFLTILNSSISKAQNIDNFENLIVNKWFLNGYEKDGNLLPPLENHQNDKMIFYANHKTASINGTLIQNGIWKYDFENQILIVTFETNNMVLKVLKI